MTDGTMPAMPGTIGVPGELPQTGNYTWLAPGLSKLEYFSAQAMIGLLANYRPEHFSGGMVQMANSIAETSVEMANKLINELNKDEHDLPTKNSL